MQVLPELEQELLFPQALALPDLEQELLSLPEQASFGLEQRLSAAGVTCFATAVGLEAFRLSSKSKRCCDKDDYNSAKEI